LLTRLQTLKLLQIAIALPAYAVPASMTFAFAVWCVMALPIGLLTSQSMAHWHWFGLWLVLLLFSQWACWSIFADALEDIPPVRHLLLLWLGVILTVVWGLSAWIMFHLWFIWLMCGTQGMAAGVLLVINLLRKRAGRSAQTAES